MTREPWRSIRDVCDVTLVRGARAEGDPDLLLEVPHGATLAEHYDALRRELRSALPPDLREFFFVNTDVGAPEVALRIAELVVGSDPRRSAAVLRCRIPRTFIDCNRVIDADATPRTSAAGEMTAGIHAWVREPADVALLLARYRAYRGLASAAFERVCGQGGGLALMVHSYAPRSVDVPVDERVVASLRAAYAPDRIGSWPLRAPVDFIVDTPARERLASSALLAAARRELAAAGFEAVENGAYALHPATLAHEFAARYAGRTLCLELRRDLLVHAFTPFEEMRPDPERVERVAAPLAAAVSSVLDC